MDKLGLEITCSWLEIILEVEVIVLVIELVADRAQDCVLDDDDVALLVIVDLLELDSSGGGWVGVRCCCCCC